MSTKLRAIELRFAIAFAESSSVATAPTSTQLWPSSLVSWSAADLF
jgi:hypothetical protein